MRSMVCEDGHRRILAKVVVPMGVAEIATYAMSNLTFMGNDNAMNEFEALNKRELFSIAKDAVAYFGDDLSLAEDRVKVTWSDRQVDRCTAHVRRLFPEVD